MELLIILGIIAVLYVRRKRVQAMLLRWSHKNGRSGQRDVSSAPASDTSTKAKAESQGFRSPMLFALAIGTVTVLGVFLAVTVDTARLEQQVQAFSWNAVAPYVLAPLFGWFVYNFSNKHYHNVPVAVGATLIGMAVIFLWLHPEILAAVIEPFGGTEAGEQLMDGDAPDWLTRIAIIAFILAILSGYVLEAIVFLILFLILF